MSLTIEHDLATGRVVLHAPYSTISLPASEPGLKKLAAILELVALAEAETHHVEKRVRNHDLEAMLKSLASEWNGSAEWKSSGCAVMRNVKRYDERGKRAVTLADLGL